jgi:ABC-type transport system involved in cytochrome c biogenesis permease subunit
MRLWNNVGIYMQLQNALQPQNAREWRKELDTYVENIPAGVTAARAQQQGQEYNKEALDRLVDDLGRFDAMLRLNGPLLVPPADHPGHNHTKDDWLRMGQALMDMARGEPPHFAVMAYADMASAFRNGRTAEFNQGVSSYRTALGSTFGPELEKAASEQRFNFFEPFYKAMTPYVLAFVLVLVFWLNPARFDFLRRTAFWLVMLALVVHTAGLIYRMVLEGRPPVTNLYSSAIFIGWGAVVLGLILEAFWRNGIGIIIGSVLGFITLIIAHHLALSGDTMEMMRAVLDTNFWLATHVVIITLGYSATFVAGFLAIVFILRGVLTSGLDGPTAKGLGKMVYGIICFATLFSFVGTVLGGIWADQSWGRFWGWDAKENGALMIVLWNALILHARWGGLVRERGLMNLAIGGNIVTAWSWFGVNMLGIGLHSYGFMDAAFWWLLGFAISQLALIALGSLPLRMWRSFRGTPQNVPPPADALPA